MEVRIAVAGAESGQGAALIDLYRWLRRDPDVHRHAAVGLAPSAPGSGTMGAVDVIELVVGQGLTALNLALAYAAWRRTRHSAPPLTIHVNGGSLTVHDASEETVRRIVAELSSLEEREAREGDEEPPADGPGTD
ncbi:hypothetical protein AMK31_03140 [Streptomyces sp. TSRI0107]|nr:hypothetical protein AMK31_03140 [Streptomyces sp. TSRI0107]